MLNVASRIGDLLLEPSVHLPRRVYAALWIGSVVLVLGGALLYLLDPDDWSWWVGGAFGLPFGWLVIEKLPDTDGAGGGDSGPVGPP